jgi:undecaprenyl diphosphate synthase
MVEGIDPARLPRHVGVIMDGNGRWATARGLNRTQGHREGVKRAKELVERCLGIGIPCLSLYVFSTENWKRAADEVGFLMFLIRDYLREELEFYKANGIRVVHSGSLDELPSDVQEVIDSTCRDSASFRSMTVNLCINYGGRAELDRALARALSDGAARAKSLADYLDNPGLPDLDLLIRSAGEKRISNFLLWQSAYAELHFSDTLWPDFGESDLRAALLDYSRRNRKFGGVT